MICCELPEEWCKECGSIVVAVPAPERKSALLLKKESLAQVSELSGCVSDRRKLVRNMLERTVECPVSGTWTELPEPVAAYLGLLPGMRISVESAVYRGVECLCISAV